jgi:hypothetical protein
MNFYYLFWIGFYWLFTQIIMLGFIQNQDKKIIYLLLSPIYFPYFLGKYISKKLEK